MEQFTVAKIEGKRGATWLVSGRKKSGERVRRRFKTEDTAKAHQKVLMMEAINEDATTLPKVTWLSDGQLRDAERAIGNLTKGTLQDAVRFFEGNFRPVEKNVTVSDAVGAFMESKESSKKKLRPDTLRNLKTRTGKLVSAFGDRMVNDITVEELDKLVTQQKTKDVTKNNDLRVHRDFFRYTTERKWTADNVAQGIDLINLDDAEPETLTIEQCKSILRSARDFKDGRMLGIYTVSLFCGLRPSEARRLVWSKVNLSDARLTVSSEGAKKRQRRSVEIPPVAVEWLKMCPVKRGKFQQPNYRKDLAKVRDLAGFRPERLPTDKVERKKACKKPKWPQDVMRHTAISMRLEQTQSEDSTALWGGTSADMVHKHYKGLVSSSEMKAFYDLTPDAVDSDNVVKMHQQTGS